MSRGQLTKDHFKVLILQQKNKVLQESKCQCCKDLANKHLTEILDRLDEFRY